MRTRPIESTTTFFAVLRFIAENGMNSHRNGSAGSACRLLECSALVVGSHHQAILTDLENGAPSSSDGRRIRYVIDLQRIALVQPHHQLTADLLDLPLWPPALLAHVEHGGGEAAPTAVAHLHDIDVVVLARQQRFVDGARAPILDVQLAAFSPFRCARASRPVCGPALTPSQRSPVRPQAPSRP